MILAGISQAQGRLRPGPADHVAEAAAPEAAAVSEQRPHKRQCLSSGCDSRTRAVELGGEAVGAVTQADGDEHDLGASRTGGREEESREQHAATAAADGNEETEAGTPACGRSNQCPLPLKYLRCCETEWQPSAAAATLNVRLDGRIVPSAQVLTFSRCADQYTADMIVYGCYQAWSAAHSQWQSTVARQRDLLQESSNAGASLGNICRAAHVCHTAMSSSSMTSLTRRRALACATS